MAQAQALLEAQRQVELGKIPLWHGDVTKDAFTAEQWIERIENCKRTADWNDETTIGYMYQALRGRAIHWFTNAKFRRIDTANWVQTRDDFLKVYAPAKTVRSTIANLEAKQHATESVCDYASRVTLIVTDLYSIIEPYTLPAAASLFGADISAIAAVVALPLADRQAQHNAIRLIGEDRVVQLIAVNLFVAGLKPHIRQKMVTRRYATFSAAFDAAMNYEVQLGEPKRHATVLAVDADADDNTVDNESGDDETDGGDEDEIVAEINKLTARLAKTRVNKNKNKNRSGVSGGGGGERGRVVCRYCKMTGHMQYSCIKRKNDRAPMVGPDGKPYRRRVQEVTQVSPSLTNNQTKDNPPPYQPTQEIAGIWQSPLNWY